VCFSTEGSPTRAGTTQSKGHTYFGVKWQILSLCLKGKFDTIHAFVYKGKFYAKAVVVALTAAFYAIEIGVKSPCEESWQALKKLLKQTGKILLQ